MKDAKRRRKDNLFVSEILVRYISFLYRCFNVNIINRHLFSAAQASILQLLMKSAKVKAEVFDSDLYFSPRLAYFDKEPLFWPI